MSDFQPMFIGLPDTKKAEQIKQLYTHLVECANSLFFELELYLDLPDQLDPSLLFEFLKSPKPEDFLYAKYAEYKQVSFPGLSLQKILEFKLIEVPSTSGMLVSWHTELLGIQPKIKELEFDYSLAKLWNPEGRLFLVTDDFKRELYDFVRRFTQSDRENEILVELQKIAKSLNRLVKLGVIRNNKQRWIFDIDDKVQRSLDFIPKSEKPITINPKMFVNRFRKNMV